MSCFRKIQMAVAAMLLFALPGCGSEPAAPSKSPEATHSAAVPTGSAMATAEADDLSETITLTIARFDIPSDADSSDLFTAEGGRYYDASWAELAKKFNIRITYPAYAWATRDEVLRQMLASGSAPDAMLSTLGAGACGEYRSQGLIRALPEGFESGYPKINENLGMVLRREAYQYDKKYFALPRALEGAEPYTDTTLGMYYRRDLAALSGVEIIDSYTLDELYSMFERVQADNPDLMMYGHVQPARMLELGLAQAVPEAARNNGFYLDSATGKYAYAYQDRAIIGGIKATKRFYDAAFLDRRFGGRPLWEARARFAGGELYSYSDALDIPTLDRVIHDFQAANPGAVPENAVGFAWLLDNGGNMLAAQSGNSWSEWIFGAKLEDRALNRFLALYDYLLGPDGLKMAVPGASGSMTPLVSGALEDSRVCALNPAYSDTAKQTAENYWNLRKAGANLTVLKFNAALDSYSGEKWSKAAALKPAEAIARIICETDADGVEAAWQAWLDDNGAQISGIVAELNANLTGQ